MTITATRVLGTAFRRDPTATAAHPIKKTENGKKNVLKKYVIPDNTPRRTNLPYGLGSSRMETITVMESKTKTKTAISGAMSLGRTQFKALKRNMLYPNAITRCQGRGTRRFGDGLMRFRFNADKKRSQAPMASIKQTKFTILSNGISFARLVSINHCPIPRRTP